jgi:hypothetical protein
MLIFPKKATLYQKKRDPNNPERFLKDDYGRFELFSSVIDVAIDLRVNIVKDRDGNEKSTFMDVDIPPSVHFTYGDELEYIDPFGDSYRGEIISIEENTDPLGIEVLSRFATIG